MNHPIRILYVDDSALDRELVRDALEREHGGFEVIEANDRETFLARLGEGGFNLVLSDFNILGYEGLEVLDEVQARYDGVPVIIVTGTGTEEVAVEAMKRGAADYVIKTPAHIRRLPLTIEGALRSQQLLEERRAAHQALRESEHRLRQLNETLEERVRARTQQVRALASALSLAEQGERRRISVLLHDHLQQILYALRLRLETLESRMPPELAEQAAASRLVLDQAIDVTRTLAIELDPPVLRSEGLREALLWLAQHMREAYDLDTELNIDNLEIDLRPEKRVLIVQLVRELLFNVVKHAGVERARLAAHHEDDRLVIEIADEGDGFDADALDETSQGGGLGLFSVRERLKLFGGRLDIQSAPGHGTTVRIAAPLGDAFANGNGHLAPEKG